MLPTTDTIVALSTPAGRSAIGVIRLSGPRSLDIVRILLDDETFTPKPNQARLQDLYDPATANVIDQALVTFFRAPRSFTGEDVIELSCHGSPVLLGSLLEIILRLDARTADPGEFTLRALANGRMSLTQAEAVRDLIDAQTYSAVQQANRQLRGELSHSLQPARQMLLDVIVRLESSLEFVEDDLPTIEHDKLIETVRALRESLSVLAETFKRGRLIRDGIKVTLIGRPNTGKSSLFNTLLAHERAIVTDLPGTTRDTLTEAVDFDGVPVLLTDTAGLRDVDDRVESIGVDRARRAAADADTTVLVIDGSQELTADDRALLFENSEGRRIVALNKSDLATFSDHRVAQALGEKLNGLVPITVSAKTSAGLDKLRAAILAPFTDGASTTESLIITNARHYDLLTRAIDGIGNAELLLGQRASEDIVLVGLHNALRYLGEILGETTSDDILGQIFATFCIGK